MNRTKKVQYSVRAGDGVSVRVVDGEMVPTETGYAPSVGSRSIVRPPTFDDGYSMTFLPILRLEFGDGAAT